MSVFDYVLDAILIATIFFQFHGRRLTPRNLAFPVVIVAYFLFRYLRGVPTAGHDLLLVGACVALGLVFGLGAGLFTRVYRQPKGIYARAGLLAAAFWTVGVLLRTAFSLYASNGGPSADRHIASVMRSWDITTPRAIVAALLLMVLFEVASRQIIVAVRYLRLRASGDPASGGVPVQESEV